MRTSVVASVAAALVALAGGCSTTTTDAPPSGATSSQPTAPTPSSTSGGPVVDSAACEEVRSGIDAYNLGDYDETVAHFEEAVPLAEAQDDGSKEAEQLIEAVHYYAELAASLYPDAARTSPEFAKYKAITLGQCVPAGSDATEEPGTNV